MYFIQWEDKLSLSSITSELPAASFSLLYNVGWCSYVAAPWVEVTWPRRPGRRHKESQIVSQMLVPVSSSPVCIQHEQDLRWQWLHWAQAGAGAGPIVGTFRHLLPSSSVSPLQMVTIITLSTKYYISPGWVTAVLRRQPRHDPTITITLTAHCAICEWQIIIFFWHCNIFAAFCAESSTTFSWNCVNVFWENINDL